MLQDQQAWFPVYTEARATCRAGTGLRPGVAVTATPHAGPEDTGTGAIPTRRRESRGGAETVAVHGPGPARPQCREGGIAPRFLSPFGGLKFKCVIKDERDFSEM